VLLSLYVLSNTYYVRKELNPYVYRPNISPFLAIKNEIL
jgi:hypothetical protein